MSFVTSEEIPEDKASAFVHRVPYTMRLPYDLVHKINTTAGDLKVPKHALIEELLVLGLKVYLDPKINPSHKPIRTARDVLMGLVAKVSNMEAHGSPDRLVVQAGKPNDARPVRPGELEPDIMNHEEPDDFDDMAPVDDQ